MRKGAWMVGGDANQQAVPFSAQRASGPIRCVVPILVLGLCCHAAVGHAYTLDEGRAEAAVATGDCSRMGVVRDREACVLALPKDQCKAIGPACTSLQQARVQDAALAHLEQDILARSKTRYAGYLADDAEYLSDLQASFSSSSAAWRAYRDAYCQAEPLVQGMSRDEQQALALDCRLRLTRERIAQLEQLAKAIP